MVTCTGPIQNRGVGESSGLPAKHRSRALLPGCPAQPCTHLCKMVMRLRVAATLYASSSFSKNEDWPK